MARILLVDDEVSLLHSMKLQLTRAGHECFCVETVAAAYETLQQADPALAIVDIRLPDGNGLDWVRRVRSEGHDLPIVVLTAFGSIPNAVKAMREGTNDYIEKPVDLDQLSFIVERNLETERLKGRVEFYERTAADQHAHPDIVGSSDAFQEVMTLAQRVASPGVQVAADMPTVLITGETGTGKDVIARYIHNAGPLADQPFVHVDCASLPGELIESELFGHERGAFTDAKSAKRGLLEIASGGTVFLNEIGEMPMSLQAKLLTTLERKCFRRVGGTRDVRMNARIVAATNADLHQRVDEKLFREDLFYRLNVFSIHLPPLRERGQDVLLLADHFLKQMRRKYRRSNSALTGPARQAMLAYGWPGNVRELSHVLERASLLAESEPISPAQLAITHTAASAVGTDHVPARAAQEVRRLAVVEREMIELALQKTGGNVSQAARDLGITRGALRRRLEAFARDDQVAGDSN